MKQASGTNFQERTLTMKTASFLRWCCAGFAGSLLLTVPSVSAAPGTIVFGNNNSSRVLVNGSPVTSAANVQAALYWAPLGSVDFVALGAPTPVGSPGAGLFAGGARTCGTETPGGISGRFQVRAWSGGATTHEQALAIPGVLIGQSTVVEVKTGDPVGDPPMPPTSLLAGGWEGFSLVTNTIAPLVVTCPTNKTVECGAPWQFDEPSISGGCGSSPVLSVSSTVTNGICPWAITRTWAATDGCTTNTCSQTVTVVDTTAPSLHCASSKSVACGSTWDFDPPMAGDSCDSSAVVVTVLSTVTNGSCPLEVTRFWLATDVCGHTNVCSQVVSEVDTTPPVLTCAPGKSVVCGSAWDFDPPTALDACSGTNVIVTVLSTVTNGTCPGSVTRTWVAADVCGNTNQCSQEITLVPPQVPDLSWPAVAEVTYGTPLGDLQLNATSTVPGSLVYTPPAGTVLLAGTNLLSVVFTPFDTTNYTTATASNFLVVLPAQLSVVASNASRPYGQTNPILSGTINGVVSGDVITAAFHCEADEQSLPGEYAIVPVLSDPDGRLINYSTNLQNGILTVTPTLPEITSQPMSLAVGIGSSASFAVTAAGSPPLAYQWFFQSAPILGGTSPDFTISSARLTNSGDYQVVVTNVAGTVTSVVATLTVTNVITSRIVSIPNATNWPGGSVDLTIDLAAQGNENTLGFSLSFDPAKLSFRSCALGSAMLPESTLFVNTNETSSGRVGLLLGLPAGETFAAGTRHLLVLTLQVSPDIVVATNLVVAFSDQPVSLEIGNANADVLPSQFTDGLVVVAPGYEADVSPRPLGDGRLTATDWTLVGRFVAGLSTVVDASEFARADCAPRATSGDGHLTATDWTQAGRYVVAFDPLQPIGGPSAPTPGLRIRQPKDGGTGRAVQLSGLATAPGEVTPVSVQLLAQGDENTLAFTMTFDPVALRFSTATPGTSLPVNTQLMINTNDLANGRLGVLLGLAPGATFSAGTQQVLVVTFIGGSPTGITQTQVGFGDAPVVREIGSALAEILPAEFLPVRLAFGPPAPPTLGVSWGAGREMRLAVSGTPGALCTVQYLDQLPGSQWQSLTTVTLAPSPTVVVDPTPTTNHTRFYRALRLP